MRPAEGKKFENGTFKVSDPRHSFQEVTPPGYFPISLSFNVHLYWFVFISKYESMQDSLRTERGHDQEVILLILFKKAHCQCFTW